MHRLKLLIYENSQESGLLEGEIEVNESYLAVDAKVNVVAVLATRFLFLDCLSVMITSMLVLSLMPKPIA